ncbi:MAG TPA: ABC transporter ATP-binding protein, partial [Acholeplasma sp.]
MKSIKKVWRYIRRYKKLLTISIICMLIVQVLGLVAPLIVKSILDDQLVGITKPWYETTDTNGVEYQGKYYTQDDESGNPITIIINQGKYYIVFSAVEHGQQSIKDSTLTVTHIDGESY